MISPSSLAALELCPRKYAWDKVDKIPREGNAYARFGTEVHKRVEAYYLHGVMPDLAEPEGNCAAALLAHLPPPQPGIRVEEHRVHDRFHGYPDLTLGNRVWDHKTTSDHRWALAPEALPLDLQAAIYALMVMHETGELRVQLQWNYVTRSKPRVLPVIREVTYGDIAPTIDRAHRLADQADDILARQATALSLPPNLAACDMYGGCVHRTRCHLSPGDRLGSLLDQADRTEDVMHWTETPEGHRKYAEAFNAAVARANLTGCDVGLEKNDFDKDYHTFLLPQPQYRQGHELRCQVVRPGEPPMTNAADFLKEMAAKHPAPPAPPAPPTGNPWDGLPPTHVTETHWYDANRPGGADWVPKAKPPPAPPPPAAAAPTSVPINPPVPPGPPAPPSPPAAAQPPPPAPPAETPARRGPGRPRKVQDAAPPESRYARTVMGQVDAAAAAPAVEVLPGMLPTAALGQVADALESLAAAVRALGGG